MGVAFLWNILEPVKRHVPLDDLRGKTLAVDLSLWVCEAQTVKQMIGVVTKPHLRNLFFRVSSLTLMGVKLVFVMEGEPPKVKAETMMMRNEMRYGPSKSSAPSRPGRSYFTSVLKECLRLLDCLGIPWVQAAGEAEAMCAYLNANGYVDGCITNDGDVFLYGAQTVYRNFTMNVKDPHVDCYKTESIKEALGLDRDALVGIAILLGCDYLPKGTPGVGKNQVLKLMQMLNGQSILQRFDQWAEQFQNGKNAAKSAKKVTHCTTCCHPGSTKDHERGGCTLCGSKQYCVPHDYSYLCPCPWHQAQREKKNNALEDTIKRRARACTGFPFREVIEEFMISKDKQVKRISWLRPNMLSFQNFAYEKMEWPKHYSCEKVFVLLTYHDMTERAAGRVDSRQLQASRIVKMRVRNGTPCFEIHWEKPEHYVFTSEEVLESFPVSIEEVSLFQAAYPEIVALYKKEQLENEDKKLKGKKSKPKKKQMADPDDIAQMIMQLSLQPTNPTISSPVHDVQGPCEDCSDSELEVKPLLDRIDLQKNQTELRKVSINDPSIMLNSYAKKNTSAILSTVNTVVKTHDSHNSLAMPSKASKECPNVASLNISSVISDLHLSSIDWEVDVFVSDAEVGSLHPPPTVNMTEKMCTSVNSLESPAQVNRQCLDLPSPSLSAVISELQLSSIDWDSSSFCSSPRVEAPSRSISKAITGKQEDANCGNTANRPQSRAAKSNIENILPTNQQIPLDRSSVNSAPNEEIVAGNLHRRPLAERVLLKNGCQLSCPKPQKEWDSKANLPKPLRLAECKRQVANSWTGKSSTPRSFCSWESEKILPSKQGQKSTAASQMGVSKKSATAVPSMGKIKPMLPRIESIKAGAAPVSSSMKTSAVQVKEVSSVSTYGNTNNKAGLNAITKKSVCHKPLNSSGDDSDSGDMMSNKYTLNVKHKEKGTSAPLSNKFVDTLVTQKTQNGCKEERVDFRLPMKHFNFNNVALLPVSRASAAHSSKGISTLASSGHRTHFIEVPASPGSQSIEEESVICDSPLPLSERIKMRLL